MWQTYCRRKLFFPLAMTSPLPHTSMLTLAPIVFGKCFFHRAQTTLKLGELGWHGDWEEQIPPNRPMLGGRRRPQVPSRPLQAMEVAQAIRSAQAMAGLRHPGSRGSTKL